MLEKSNVVCITCTRDNAAWTKAATFTTADADVGASEYMYLGGDEELLASDDALLDGHLDTLSNLDLVTIIAGAVQESIAVVIDKY